jgi:predicted ATPase/DNA-binding SARP family transcriptional activator
MFWPDTEEESARHNLRLALSSLRRQLEPPGIEPGTVVRADRLTVQIPPEVVTTDVAEFEAALKAAADTPNPPETTAHLVRALELYGGDLLPGYYEEWVLPQQLRLKDEAMQARVQLAELLAQAGDLHGALSYAQRAAESDPTCEEYHLILMRLYIAAGQSGAALRQYARLEQALQASFGEEPSSTACALAEKARHTDATTPYTAVPNRDRDATDFPPHPQSVVPQHAQSSPSFTQDVPVPSPNLPLQLTRFFGRETEIAQIRALLPHTRLLTLTGPGGTGKTRISLEVAGHLGGSYSGSVWFVPLAEILDVRRIFSAIVESMALPRSGTEEPLESIVRALAVPAALLVLDNFEQLAAEGANTVVTLLSRAPTLTCLITSRQRLNLEGEWEYPIPPLPTPNEQDGLEVLCRCASVQVFVDRARMARPDFQVTRTNGQAVSELCRRLEGLPLALELAAARAKVLSPAQMLGQLANRLDFFMNRRREAAPRHRTLRAAIDWSYRLLSPELQGFFARLSVFRGGWTAEAAESVCEEPFALDRLEQLRDASLILGEERGEEMRFRMLETLREYAAQQLSASERATCRRRHVAYFFGFAEAAEPRLRGAEQSLWLDRLEAEHDNLRSALDACAAEEGDAATIQLRLAGALWRYWLLRGHITEGRERLTAALARPALEGRKAALLGAGVLAVEQGDLNVAQHLFQENLSLWRESGDEKGIARALNALGSLNRTLWNLPTARRLLEESLELRRKVQDLVGIADTLFNISSVALDQKDYAAATAFLDECLALYQSRGDRYGTAEVLNMQGLVAREEGRLLEAKALHTRSLEIVQELNNRQGIASTLNNLAEVLVRQDEPAAAHDLLQKALTINRESQHWDWIAINLSALGEAACQLGDFDAAQAFLTESLEIRCRMKRRFFIPRTLARFAHLAFARGQDVRATRLYGAEAALNREIGHSAAPVDLLTRDAHLAALRERLGPSTFEAAYEAGGSLTWDQAVHEALQPCSGFHPKPKTIG